MQPWPVKRAANSRGERPRVRSSVPQGFRAGTGSGIAVDPGRQDPSHESPRARNQPRSLVSRPEAAPSLSAALDSGRGFVGGEMAKAPGPISGGQSRGRCCRLSKHGVLRRGEPDGKEPTRSGRDPSLRESGPEPQRDKTRAALRESGRAALARRGPGRSSGRWEGSESRVPERGRRAAEAAETRSKPRGGALL